eukprot:scaffold98291_cov32-Tisochrysis_lutea.AAC.1
MSSPLPARTAFHACCRRALADDLQRPKALGTAYCPRPEWLVSLNLVWQTCSLSTVRPTFISRGQWVNGGLEPPSLLTPSRTPRGQVR